jgi:NAD/NADP transhydrogenase beta subunit
VVTAALKLPRGVDLIVEYAAGFLFGWTIFQALFMKNIMGGSYKRSLRATVLPELLSMNGVMAGMAVVMVPWMTHDLQATQPTSAHFWFTMSIALTAGFVIAYQLSYAGILSEG